MTLEAFGMVSFSTGRLEMFGMQNFGATFSVPGIVTIGPNFKLFGVSDYYIDLLPTSGPSRTLVVGLV